MIDYLHLVNLIKLNSKEEAFFVGHLNMEKLTSYIMKCAKIGRISFDFYQKLTTFFANLVTTITVESS